MNKLKTITAAFFLIAALIGISACNNSDKKENGKEKCCTKECCDKCDGKNCCEGMNCKEEGDKKCMAGKCCTTDSAGSKEGKACCEKDKHNDAHKDHTSDDSAKTEAR